MVLEGVERQSGQKFMIGNYLGTRFEQIGLKHYYFMVPGDYNLVLLDQLLQNKTQSAEYSWNELNAAYAAEGYARANDGYSPYWLDGNL